MTNLITEERIHSNSPAVRSRAGTGAGVLAAPKVEIGARALATPSVGSAWHNRTNYSREGRVSIVGSIATSII
ncbi:UNVERIFIED_CONTAM: hypothetical protein Sradi_1900000 [Sesamum radiatum]|uniref:Uncharacterized protein n=1 Tax=Sesamum radiatum TaxID=300843 RepID=A0AAW2TXC7_SESRA